MVNPAAWKGASVLVTGHTGFKGGWLSHWLCELGAEVTGCALQSDGAGSLYECLRLESRLSSNFQDINDRQQLDRLVQAARPDVIFHLAAQSLVRPGYRQPVETFSTNIMGTVNVL